MKQPSAPPAVAFREVRHFQPDDCLHYETLEVRGRIHDWTIPEHRHQDLHQLQFIDGGSVVATVDGLRHALRAPAALLLAPGSVHGLAYERGCTGHQVTVPSALLRRLLAQALLLESRLSSTLVLDGAVVADDAAELKSLFLQLAREFSATEPGRIEALQAHALLLALWFLRRGAAPAAERRQALRDTLVQRYRSLLELHWRRHAPLAFYADALDVTVDHLSRICRRVTGLSALQLMHERMMQAARQALAAELGSVLEVARELGFDDPAYFSRFFARQAGQSPSDYRAALASGRGVPAR